MYGSIRACCAATTELKASPGEGIQWGDPGERGRFRHAGFSEGHVGKIVPGEVYSGTGEEKTEGDDKIVVSELAPI